MDVLPELLTRGADPDDPQFVRALRKQCKQTKLEFDEGKRENEMSQAELIERLENEIAIEERIGEALRKQRIQLENGDDDAARLLWKTCETCSLQFGDGDDEKRTPRVLDCGHTVCHECAEMLQRDSVIRCPMCGERGYCGDVANLQKNFLVLQM